jgi:hypothetical protein
MTKKSAPLPLDYTACATMDCPKRSKCARGEFYDWFYSSSGMGRTISISAFVAEDCEHFIRRSRRLKK